VKVTVVGNTPIADIPLYKMSNGGIGIITKVAYCSMVKVGTPVMRTVVSPSYWMFLGTDFHTVTGDGYEFRLLLDGEKIMIEG
jgi:hypothetical protein